MQQNRFSAHSSLNFESAIVRNVDIVETFSHISHTSRYMQFDLTQYKSRIIIVGFCVTVLSN